MEDLRAKIMRSYKMEMIGAGCYDKLAKHYHKRLPELSEKLWKFSEQERMHGRLLAQCYRDSYGEDIRGGKFWLFIGKISAVSQYLLPLKIKLEIVGGVEKFAVREIESALADGAESGFHKVIRAILPDEKEHAGFSDEWFAAR